MDWRGLKHLGTAALAALAALAGCNAVTGVGQLDFSRDPASPGGTGGETGSGAAGSTSSAGGGGAGGGVPAEPWGLQYGDSIEDYPAMLALAPGGDIVMTGTFAGTVDFGAGDVSSQQFEADAFVARYDPAGGLRFVVPFDTGAVNCAMDSAVTPQGDVLTLVGTGTTLTDCISAAYTYKLSLGADYTNRARYEVLLVDASGMSQGSAPLCDPCSPNAIGPLALATDATGAAYIAGSVAETSVVAGDSLTASGIEDMLVVKLDPSGAPVWVRNFGAQDSEANATDILVDAQGGIVVAGRFRGSLPLGAETLQAQGTQDIFLTRLDPATGNPTWSRSFPEAHLLAPPRLAGASDGIFMTGDFLGEVSFGGPPLVNTDPQATTSDAYLAKLGFDGGHLWSVRFGETPGPSSADQGGTGISFDASGNILLVGGFAGSIDLGDQTFDAHGYLDGFAARLSPSGQVLSAWHLEMSQDGPLGDLMVVAGAPGLIVAGAFWGDLDYGGAEPLQSRAQSESCEDIFVVGLPLP